MAPCLLEGAALWCRGAPVINLNVEKSFYQGLAFEHIHESTQSHSLLYLAEVSKHCVIGNYYLNN